MGDENSLALPVASGPKLLSKSSMNSMSTTSGMNNGLGTSRVSVSTKGVSVSAASGLGKNTVGISVNAGPRRALVDVSNAARVSVVYCFFSFLLLNYSKY